MGEEKKTKKAVVFLADGFEEVEAVAPIDFLRRAGVEVVVVSLNDNGVSTGAHRIPVVADVSLAGFAAQFAEGLGADEWDAALLPGGMPGASNLAASETVGAILKALAEKGALIAAVCAAPVVVLHPLGLLTGRRFTCYPGLEKMVAGARWSEDDVVIDGDLITSRGAGTAGVWAVAIIGKLLGEDAADDIAASVLVRR
ncbi:MAG: DJ-1/PfpI family protein [Treponema sp.]|jgi:4-methyl-5(b-hydroxyethyl)-thiazole monophosphate biosynthesis|nr:DJ-1/PfpI family protein [Treponema sp.]